MSDLDDNYHVKYKYKKLDNNKTEMEYFEWVKTGKLENPFTKKGSKQAERSDGKSKFYFLVITQEASAATTKIAKAPKILG